MSLNSAVKALESVNLDILKTATHQDLGAVVDELGQLKAQMATLKEREDLLKATLIEAGVAEVNGASFRATVSRGERESWDDVMKARIEELIEEHVSIQFRTAHKVVSAFNVVRVVARKSR